MSLIIDMQLSRALLDAELQNKRRFMKGKVTSRAYEQLTPQEIRDLRLVFDVFDTDRSGLVIQKLKSFEMELYLQKYY